MRLTTVCLLLFIIGFFSVSGQDQIDKLSINIGYTCTFPKVANPNGNLMIQSNHDYLFNLSYDGHIWKRFDYQLGKGLVKYDNNEMFPINSINNMAMQQNGIRADEIHIDFVLQGTAGIFYKIPFVSTKNKWKIGILGAYDISLRKETNAQGVNFAMKQYYLKFSQADLFATLDYRRNRYSINIGYRIFKVRLFDDILNGDKSGAQFVNESKFRVTLGYHFRNEHLMRGSINFPGVEMDE